MQRQVSGSSGDERVEGRGWGNPLDTGQRVGEAADSIGDWMTGLEDEWISLPVGSFLPHQRLCKHFQLWSRVVAVAIEDFYNFEWAW